MPERPEKFTIKTKIDTMELWAGIGGYFDSLGQIINEFVDNAVSNFEANAPAVRNIIITLRELPNSTGVEVTIEDSGTGIKNLDAAFTMGSHAAAETPLNEHGFGIKHALASANPQNDNWAIYTRLQEDYDAKKIVKIEAPYSISDIQGECVEEIWPGQLNGTGTLVKFTCSWELFKTIAQGIKGGVTHFETICDILIEDLGFVYAGIIADGKAGITVDVRPLTQAPSMHAVGAVMPDWEGNIDPGKGSERYDLGHGEITIEYAFGFIKEKQNRVRFDNTTTRKYYKLSTASSGVEIRVNGRVLAYNLYEEIWGGVRHNSHNRLLITLNLKSEDSKMLPQTTTAKNGFRQGDEKLEKLYEWIRAKCSNPPKDMLKSKDELDRFKAIAERQKKALMQQAPATIVETEKYAFTRTGNKNDLIRIDMYISCMGKITIYEGKVNTTTSKDVYQLRMYWDGLVFDGIKPTEGILLAEEHPESVRRLLEIVNSMKDAEGNNYNLTLKHWEDM